MAFSSGLRDKDTDVFGQVFHEGKIVLRQAVTASAYGQQAGLFIRIPAEIHVKQLPADIPAAVRFLNHDRHGVIVFGFFQVHIRDEMPAQTICIATAEREELPRIQKDLSKYAEQAMACFVTGDIPLDDANWQVFCEKVHELGLDDAVSIWQKYVK